MLSTRQGRARGRGAAKDGGGEARGDLPPGPRRILVIRLGALGDVVRTRFAFPGLRERYPEARIDWLVEDRAAAGLAGMVGLDGIVRVPRSRLGWRRPLSSWEGISGLLRELRGRRYDLAVDFHGILKSALLAWWIGIPVRVGCGRGLAREGSHLLLTHRVRVPSTHVSRFERNAALVRFLGGRVPSRPPLLDLPEPAFRREDLPEHPVVIHPGTSASTLYKRWEPSRYADLAVRLREKAQVSSLVTWGPVPGEQEAAERVVREARGAAQLAPPPGRLSDLLHLLRRARLFIGSDSGPMHLASLVGAPVLALFGPTDPVENSPFPGVPSRVLRHDVGCNPCRKGCPVRACMDAIRVGEALAAALELVAAGPRLD